MRLGKVDCNIRLTYVVDLDNPAMVDLAKDLLEDDVNDLYLPAYINQYECSSLKPEDISTEIKDILQLEEGGEE